MAVIRPFCALRPTPANAAAVAAVPYDVVSTEEARELASGNPLSFLHVSRAEIDLPDGTDPYDQKVYDQAISNLETLAITAPLVVESAPSLYVYRLRTNDHEQTGIAGCFSLDEYDRNIVKRHERTRPDKEDDRTRHMLALGAQTGIVFLTYRAQDVIEGLTTDNMSAEPLVDIVAPDGVQHTVWRMSPNDAENIVAAFGEITSIYIADGHHRIASAARARDELRDPDPASKSRYFLGVAFPDTSTRILPYNRTVADLAGQTTEEFLAALGSRFPVTQNGSPEPQKGQVSMYVAGAWYGIDFGPLRSVIRAEGEGLVKQLDVAILQEHVLAPLLSVKDIRTDPRVAFVGGSRGTAALVHAVDSGAAEVAFSLAAVTPSELLAISDAGDIMPPKSTWFEPKLRDGLLTYRFLT